MSRPPDRITNRPSDEFDRPPHDEIADGLPRRRRFAEYDEDSLGGRFALRGRPREEWPLWVQLGLWGLPNRASAWFFFWGSTALAAGGVACGFVHPLFFVGGLVAFAALWYYAAIRWVDRHGRWE